MFLFREAGNDGATFEEEVTAPERAPAVRDIRRERSDANHKDWTRNVHDSH